jgi:uncharacterized protein YlxP (DUF503 family)
MAVGILTVYLHLPGCASLKEKRSRLKPLLARLHREFNISVAEIDRQDSWQEAVIACALVSNEKGHADRSLRAVVNWIESAWPDVSLVDDQIEII